MPHPRRTKRSALALCALVWVGAAACGDDPPIAEGVIDRDTFVETYVDLRAATVEGDETALPAEQRDSILAVHGVDAESLVAFVDAYGRDLDYMKEVWDEVERRFEARSPEPDSTGRGAD